MPFCLLHETWLTHMWRALEKGNRWTGFFWTWTKLQSNMKGILKNKNVKSMLIPFRNWQMTFCKPKTFLYDIINAASCSVVVSINKKGKTLRPLVFLGGGGLVYPCCCIWSCWWHLLVDLLLSTVFVVCVVHCSLVWFGMITLPVLKCLPTLYPSEILRQKPTAQGMKAMPLLHGSPRHEDYAPFAWRLCRLTPLSLTHCLSVQDLFLFWVLTHKIEVLLWSAIKSMI